tara:strand:+ start:419 stop:754 length:336 start_codon:yes stop_codon:yes gene_type:complete
MTQNSRLVYSTSGCNLCDDCKKPLKKCRCLKLQSKKETENGINVYFEKKGRKGSGVTVIRGVVLSKNELKCLTTNLKKYCGVGGSIKHNNQIELQGDQRQQVKLYINQLVK